ncbi:MAG: ATP phosphoribosyltransferase regulatory subunit [Phycisphaerales bacterium]
MASGENNQKKSLGKIKPPKGTRDLYPEDALKRRYLEQAWRDASVRCGFEEIHGPTFETTDLYSVKSGDGILGELFQAYSGKAPEEVAQVQQTGRAPYAIRPEFTPTLARMFASKAGALPRPCKWFTGGPYFRAERPQRGRLREFLQWNVDFIGDDGTSFGRALADVETMSVAVTLMRDVGLTPKYAGIVFSDRRMAEAVLTHIGATVQTMPLWLAWIDSIPKNPQAAVAKAHEMGLTTEQVQQVIGYFFNQQGDSRTMAAMGGNPAGTPAFAEFQRAVLRVPEVADSIAQIQRSASIIADMELGGWGTQHNAVVRGLAYYTGLVFEIIADGERAVAGGGRYDKLIELMGGPATPAVGFAMGDVVVSLLLEDKGLMPEGAELMQAVSRRPASVRPEVFVVGADDEESDALVRRLSASLRRGIESDRYLNVSERKPWSAERFEPVTNGVRPMHARVSYKTTRNLKKLLADGEKQFARLAAIVHGRDRVQLKDFDSRQDLTPKDVGLSDSHAEFSVDPASPVYVGRAAVRVVG